jgi:hypothetical protein
MTDGDDKNPPTGYQVARRAALANARAMLTADGARWEVYEFVHPALDRRSGPVLVFESDTLMRLVRSFPENWRDLSDDDLLGLSEGL